MLPDGLAPALRQAGHDVLFALEDASGAPDADLLDRAFRERRLLLSEHLDYGDLVVVRERPNHGVLLLRIGELSGSRQASLALSLIAREGEALHRALSVIEPDRTRVRQLE